MSGKLQEKVDYYEFLIDFVSHEIRNPLSAIIMFGRLLREGTYGPMDARHAEVMDRILANAGRIEHMTDDFLNLARVESAGGILQAEELDLYEDVIVPVVDALEKKLLFTPQQKHTFVRTVPPSVRVAGDRALLGIVFDNLFYNAVKYGREGGQISYGWEESRGQVLITISNEGVGVRKKDLGRIFEKFVRLKDPGMPPRKGTGLGLYNVRKIIAMHQGRIWAESEYGVSFTIRFTLPRTIRPTSRRRQPAT